MSYTALSFSPNEVLTSGKMNQVAANDAALKDGSAIDASAIIAASIAAKAVIGEKLGEPVAFRAVPSASTTLTNGNDVALTLGTEVYDYGSNFASNQFTAPYDGVYHFDGNVGISGTISSGILMYAAIFVNGAAAARGGLHAPPNFAHAHVSAGVELSAGDTVKLYGKQSSSGNEATSTTDYVTYMSGHLVGRTD